MLILGLIIKCVLKFDNEFDGLTKSVHHQLLVSELLDTSDSELLLLLEQFCVKVLLFTLESPLLNGVDFLLRPIS